MNIFVPAIIGHKAVRTFLKSTASLHKLAAVISWAPSPLDRVSVPSPIAIDILMDTMARDRAHMYLFFV